MQRRHRPLLAALLSCIFANAHAKNERPVLMARHPSTGRGLTMPPGISSLSAFPLAVNFTSTPSFDMDTAPVMANTSACATTAERVVRKSAHYDYDTAKVAHTTR